MPEESNIPMGSAASLAGTAQPAAPAQSQTPVSAPVPESDLASALRHEMQSRFSGARQVVDNSLPAGLVAGAQPPAQPTQPTQPAQPAPDANGQINELQGKTGEALETQQPPEEKPPEENNQPENQDPAREDGREEITAIHLEKFGRDFSLAEVEAAIEGFNYYHPKALKFQEDLQRFQAEKQQFEQLKNSPDMQLVNMLKSDPGLKERFLQAAREHDPQKIQAHEGSQEILALKSEIEQLKGMLNQNQQKQQANETQQKQQAWQNHVVNTTRAVDQAMTKKLESLKGQGVEISESELEMISQNAVALVKSGQMQYSAASVTDYFNKMIDMIASKALKARQVGIQNYQQAKKDLPPPPPSGGAAPVIRPDSPKNFNEMQDVMANRLEAVLKKL